MGLQNQLSDVSSESILVIMVVLIARSASYLHSLLLAILHNLALIISFHDHPDDEAHVESSLYDVVGSGLTNLILLCDQLSLNRDRSYTYEPEEEEGGPAASCVVCLNRFGSGDHVRRLECRHVFHRDCLDGWLDHLNFSCPLCRAPMESDERVDDMRRRVAGDLLAWIPAQ